MSSMQERLRKAAETSDKAFKENYPNAGTTPGAPGNTPPVNTETAAPNTPPTETPPGSPASTETKPPETVPPVTVTPPATEPPRPTETPPSTTPPPSTEADYKKLYEEQKHKFEVLEGKYKKEITEANANSARAMQEVADIKIQMSQLANQVNRPNGKPTVEGHPTASTESSTFALSSEQSTKSAELKKEYPDMIASGLREFILEVCYEAMGGFVKDYLPKLKKVEEIEKRVVMGEVDLFKKRLTDLIPDWATLDTDQAFVTYLQGTVEKITGMSLLDLIRAAHARGDVEAVAEIMNQYKTLKGIKPSNGGNGHATVTPPAETTPPATASPSASTLPPNLAPPRPAAGKPGEGSPAPSTENKPTYTPTQVRTFYQDCVKGVYRGREAEMKRIEADINLASQEGRIR